MPVVQSDSGTTALEAALRRERLLVLAGLAGTVALAWLYLVPASLDMYGDMDGPSAWMMAFTWDLRYFALIVAMWIVMMIGMMLPSATPTILLFARAVRSSPGARAPVLRTYLFAAGYAAAWSGFSVAAAGLQYALASAAVLSPMMITSSPLLGAGILVAAGVYQWTPLKRACLTRCRTPLDWLSRNWRSGYAGAVRMGVSHGLVCIGCCWMLMLLLFFGGVMNLLWIAAITGFVLVEKLAPYGVQGGRLSGLLLVAAGLWVGAGALTGS